LHRRTTRANTPLRLLVGAAVVGAVGFPAAQSTADASNASATTSRAQASGSERPQQHGRAERRASPKPRFPGHRPGRIYLGMSCGELCHRKIPQLNQDIGVHRWYRKWGNWRGVAKAIREDRRHHRLPWISIEGPERGASTGWRAVGRGRYDRDIGHLARTLKANDKKPIFIAFDHEPSNKAPNSQGKWWARGYIHLYDELKRAHALRRVALAPIMADWMFNKFNHEDNPADWLLPGVLNRAPFLAVDCYQNESGDTFGKRLPRIARWLARHGHPHMMLGVGETGATNMYRNTTAVRWLNQSLRWAAHHPGRVAVVSYFNSTAYSRAGSYWPLDESAAKLAVYKRWLRSKPYIDYVR
jgi:hypothetical protein